MKKSTDKIQKNHKMHQKIIQKIRSDWRNFPFEFSMSRIHAFTAFIWVVQKSSRKKLIWADLLKQTTWSQHRTHPSRRLSPLLQPKPSEKTPPATKKNTTHRELRPKYELSCEWAGCCRCKLLPIESCCRTPPRLEPRQQQHQHRTTASHSPIPGLNFLLIVLSYSLQSH